MLQLLYQSLMTKAVDTTSFEKKIFQHLQKHLLFLLMYRLFQQHMYQSRVLDIEELKQRLSDILHGLEQSSRHGGTEAASVGHFAWP